MKVNRRRAMRLSTASLACVSLILAGCKSAKEWRDSADKVAANVIAAAQRDVTGSEEPIEIETPSDTLRRRLMLDQGLAINDVASLSIRDLPPNKYWDPEQRLLPGRENPVANMSTNTMDALEIGLLDAIFIAAHNSRDYQSAKEGLFSEALALDLTSDSFRSSFSSALAAGVSTSRSGGKRTASHTDSATPSVTKTFENGTKVTSSLALNLAGMLRGDKATAWGSLADISISIPLLRGSGRIVASESLTQAERNFIYATRTFEHTKRKFVVNVARSYMELLLAMRRRQNEDDNYRRVIRSTRRSRRLADANRMSKSDFDQSHQSELNARANWIAACQSYESTLENFKMLLGLPPDARICPKTADLDELQAFAENLVKGVSLGQYKDEDNSGSNGQIVLETPASVDVGDFKTRTDRAIQIAFSNRLDFVTYLDRVEDAQRHILIAEDSLRTEITLGGSASIGEAASPSDRQNGKEHGQFKMKDTAASGRLTIDLPWHRTSERNSYRNSLIALEQAVRSYQEQEDSLKRTIRQDMRSLSQTEENLRIQFLAVELAERRVRNQDILLQAGRADMTVVLDAQAALVSAQNSLYAAITSYKSDLLSLQSDLGVLKVSVGGVWTEADLYALGVLLPPEKIVDEEQNN